LFPEKFVQIAIAVTRFACDCSALALPVPGQIEHEFQGFVCRIATDNFCDALHQWRQFYFTFLTELAVDLPSVIGGPANALSGIP
jgi:hypothetical protein